MDNAVPLKKPETCNEEQYIIECCSCRGRRMFKDAFAENWMALIGEKPWTYICGKCLAEHRTKRK